MFLTYPNQMITKYPMGTSHCSPYRDNTHVPLIMMQRSKIEKKQICEPVSMLSLAATQSFLMGILPPSSASTECLPGIKLQKVLRGK
jgi:arylsulfatase A-like enzyme